MAVTLSRLRLSTHWGKLSRFHASGHAQLELDDLDSTAYDEVLQICRHLDLQCELLSAPTTGEALQRVVVRIAEEALETGDAKPCIETPADSTSMGAQVAGKCGSWVRVTVVVLVRS